MTTLDFGRIGEYPDFNLFVKASDNFFNVPNHLKSLACFPIYGESCCLSLPSNPPGTFYFVDTLPAGTFRSFTPSERWIIPDRETMTIEEVREYSKTILDWSAIPSKVDYTLEPLPPWIIPSGNDLSEQQLQDYIDLVKIWLSVNAEPDPPPPWIIPNKADLADAQAQEFTEQIKEWLATNEPEPLPQPNPIGDRLRRAVESITRRMAGG